MTIEDLKKRIEGCEDTTPIQFYFLTNHNLEACEVETIIEADDQVEFTVEPTIKIRKVENKLRKILSKLAH
jgi:hypothetical protein